MRRGASVSQDLAESSGPRGLRIVRAWSRRGSALVSGMAALLRKAEASCIYKLRRGVDGLRGPPLGNQCRTLLENTLTTITPAMMRPRPRMAARSSDCLKTKTPISEMRTMRSEEHTSELQSLMRIAYA